jgi:hypothetical protein
VEAAEAVAEAAEAVAEAAEAVVEAAEAVAEAGEAPDSRFRRASRTANPSYPGAANALPRIDSPRPISTGVVAYAQRSSQRPRRGAP